MPTDNLHLRLPLLRKPLRIPLLAVRPLHQHNLARTATAPLQHMPGALRSLAAVGMALRSQEDHTPRTCLGHSPSVGPSVAACTFLAVAAGTLWQVTARQRHCLEERTR